MVHYVSCVTIIYGYRLQSLDHLVLQEKCVIGEKKVGKNFQYDLPGDLVMTYLSEVCNVFEAFHCCI